MEAVVEQILSEISAEYEVIVRQQLAQLVKDADSPIWLELAEKTGRI